MVIGQKVKTNVADRFGTLFSDVNGAWWEKDSIIFVHHIRDTIGIIGHATFQYKGKIIEIYGAQANVAASWNSNITVVG